MRADVADIDLADRVFAPHYARATLCRCAAVSAMMRAAPRGDARAVSQLLMGEEFAVLDVTGGWAWGYSAHDRYVGYLPADALGPTAAPSHVVTAPLALVFAEPDIKAPVVARWPIGARLHGDVQDGFIASEAGHVHLRHASPLGGAISDYVAVAERLIGAPYLWGGRGDGGIDCSGLVQLALAFAGIHAPRDSDQQRDQLGRELPGDASLRRGDLVFLPGHVGMMVDGDRLIHANAFWMAVTVEPLADVLSRQPPDVAVSRKRIEP